MGIASGESSNALPAPSASGKVQPEYTIEENGKEFKKDREFFAPCGVIRKEAIGGRP
jgi:hypothetical protein